MRHRRGATHTVSPLFTWFVPADDGGEVSLPKLAGTKSMAAVSLVMRDEKKVREV